MHDRKVITINNLNVVFINLGLSELIGVDDGKVNIKTNTYAGINMYLTIWLIYKKL
jgi:hypothetical protein